MEARKIAGPEGELPRPINEEYEVDSRSAAEQPQAYSIAESDIISEGLKKQPIAAFEHVSKAAESNKPIEKLYETRHEIKDESDNQRAVSIGSVIADLPILNSKEPHVNSPKTEPSVTPLQSLPRAEDLSRVRTYVYKQSIKFGFIVALVLIAAWALWMLSF